MRRMVNADLGRVKRDVRIEQVFDNALSPQMIRLPILAIYAAPHNWSMGLGPDKAADSAAEKMEYADELTQIRAFQKHLPGAKVIRIPNADHYVFFSNRAQVERDVNAFLNALP